MPEIGAASEYYESQKQFGEVASKFKNRQTSQEDHKGHED